MSFLQRRADALSLRAETRLKLGIAALAEEAAGPNPHDSIAPRTRVQRRVRLSTPLLVAASVAAIAGGGFVASSVAGAGESNTRTEAPLAEPGESDAPTRSISSPEPSAVHKDHVRDIGSELAGLESRSEYGKVSLDFDRYMVSLYWKGEAPAELEEARSNPWGVAVELVTIDYSNRDLSTAADALVAAFEGRGVAVNMVEKADDLSSLVVYVEKSIGDELLASLTAEARRVTGIQTSVVRGGAVRVQPARTS